MRPLWTGFNSRQLGLHRFYPDFTGLRFDNAYRYPAVSKALILGIMQDNVLIGPGKADFIGLKPEERPRNP